MSHPKRFVLTSDQEAEVRSLVADGWGHSRIARRLRVPRSTLFSWMKRRGLTKPRHRYTEEQIEQATSMYRQGASARDISEASGIPKSSLHKALRRHMPDFDDYSTPSPTVHLTTEQEEQICRVYERTGIQAATSRITGHSAHTVRRVLEEADLLGGLPGPDRQDPSKWKLASLYFDQLPEIWWVADDTYEGYSPEMIEHRRGIAPEDQTRLLNDYSRALRLPIPQAA